MYLGTQGISGTAPTSMAIVGAAIVANQTTKLYAYLGVRGEEKYSGQVKPDQTTMVNTFQLANGKATNHAVFAPFNFSCGSMKHAKEVITSSVWFVGVLFVTHASEPTSRVCPHLA